MPEEKDQSALEAHYSSLDRAWKEYKEHGSIEARDFIINAYTPLVESTARRIFQKKPWIFEFQDLKQAGMIGLVNAVERYDPSRGILFGTYAPRRIIGSIYDEINSMDWTPRAMRQKIRKTLLAVQKFENDGAEAPTPAQVAESAGIPEQDVAIAMKHASRTHIGAVDQETVTALEGSSGARFLSFSHNSENDMSKATERIHQKLELHKALTLVCTDEEVNVLLLHFYEEKTLKQVGEELGFSSSKVSSLKRSALDKLSEVLDKEDWSL